MPLPPQKQREMVLQLLYCIDQSPETTKDSLVTLLMNELNVSKKNASLAFEQATSIQEKLKEVDEFITQTSFSYDFERIQLVERNILRLGTYELLYDDAIPEKVAISEAVRLAKKFSTTASASFVNAILDAIYKKSLGEDVDEKALIHIAEEMEEIEKITKEAAKKSSLKEDSGD